MTKFNLEDAKRGRPTVDRRNRKIEILSFNGTKDYPIVCKIPGGITTYTLEGTYYKGKTAMGDLVHPDGPWTPKPEPKTFPRKMMCFYKDKWTEELVIFDGSTVEGNKDPMPVIALDSKGEHDFFSKCMEIADYKATSPKKKVTIEEINKLFGCDVEIVG